MRIFVKNIVFFILACLIIVNISGCATYKVHPEFKERHKNIRSASMMPPTADAYLMTFKGDKKRLDDVVTLMEETTVKDIEDIFSKKGYIIKKLDLGKEALDAKPQLREALFTVNKLFTKSLEDILKGKKKTFTYSLGSDVNTFADLADSDVLVFVKEDGIKKSAGEIAKDVTKSVLLAVVGVHSEVILHMTVVHFAVVDSNDGAILWYNTNATNAALLKYDPANKKQLSGLLKILINPFPDSAFKVKDAGKVRGKPAPEKVTPEIQPVPIGKVAQ